jgi:hypothetical protein
LPIGIAHWPVSRRLWSKSRPLSSTASTPEAGTRLFGFGAAGRSGTRCGGSRSDFLSVPRLRGVPYPVERVERCRQRRRSAGHLARLHADPRDAARLPAPGPFSARTADLPVTVRRAGMRRPRWPMQDPADYAQVGRGCRRAGRGAQNGPICYHLIGRTRKDSGGCSGRHRPSPWRAKCARGRDGSSRFGPDLAALGDRADAGDRGWRRLDEPGVLAASSVSRGRRSLWSRER